MSKTLEQPSLVVEDGHPTAECKKPYHKPQLRDYGTVSELTRTSPITAATGDGGETLPNVYADS